MAYLTASETTGKTAVTGKTYEDEARAWRRWVEYCNSIGLKRDKFLDDLNKYQWIQIIGAFSVAMRQGRFSGPGYDTLAEGTIRGAISHVAQTF